jgi:nicotinamidase-related amidase
VVDPADDLHGAVPDRADTVLLILDMFSDFEFDGGAQLCRAALPVARRIRVLKRAATRHGVPTIYVNDHAGRWRADFPALLRHCASRGRRGAPIVRLLRPGHRDYRILKPKHSAFFATALGALLEYLDAKTLVLTGATSHQCVLFTANDAYVRDLRLVIPRDCTAAGSTGDTRFALRYFRSVLGADTAPGHRLRWPPRPDSAPAKG